MKAVTVISFRYNVICNFQSHEQERLYNDIALKVSAGSYLRVTDVLGALREVYPDDMQFKAAFSKKELCTTNSRNKKVVRYILFEIERQQSGRDFDFESATYNVEHILPEHPSESWFYIEESKQERLMYRLGNITPLEANRNRTFGNGDYASKRLVYQQSIFQITNAVAEHYDHWDEQKIEARQKQLATVASGIWKIDYTLRTPPFTEQELLTILQYFYYSFNMNCTFYRKKSKQQEMFQTKLQNIFTTQKK